MNPIIIIKNKIVRIKVKRNIKKTKKMRIQMNNKIIILKKKNNNKIKILEIW
jgi:hypothetical protein